MIDAREYVMPNDLVTTVDGLTDPFYGIATSATPDYVTVQITGGPTVTVDRDRVRSVYRR